MNDGSTSPAFPMISSDSFYSLERLNSFYYQTGQMNTVNHAKRSARVSFLIIGCLKEVINEITHQLI